MSAFTWIKGKLFAGIWLLISVLFVIIGYQKARNSDLKTKAEQGRADRAEAAKKASDKATEAMIIGMGDEQRVRAEIENNPVKRHDLT